MELVGRTVVMYRPVRLVCLASVILSINIWMLIATPDYVPFGLIKINPYGFAYRAWIFAVFSSFLLSFMVLRHVFYMIRNGGMVNDWESIIEAGRVGGVVRVKYSNDKRRNFSPFIVKIIES